MSQTPHRQVGRQSPTEKGAQPRPAAPRYRLSSTRNPAAQSPHQVLANAERANYGKVERSNRSDQQEFCQLLSYKNDVDLEARLSGGRTSTTSIDQTAPSMAKRPMKPSESDSRRMQPTSRPYRQPYISGRRCRRACAQAEALREQAAPLGLGLRCIPRPRETVGGVWGDMRIIDFSRSASTSTRQAAVKRDRLDLSRFSSYPFTSPPSCFPCGRAGAPIRLRRWRLRHFRCAAVPRTSVLPDRLRAICARFRWHP